MNDVLRKIYYKVYGEKFDYSQLENRIKLQKAVYFLENMGINVGDYSFSWNKFGPYSLGLDNDAEQLDDRSTEEFVFSKMAEKGLDRIVEIISKRSTYDVLKWVECIASIHYLRNVFRIKDEELISELLIRKPYLADQQDNLKAMSIAKRLDVHMIYSVV